MVSGIKYDRDGNGHLFFDCPSHPDQPHTWAIPKETPDSKDAPVPQFCNGNCSARLAALEAEMVKLKTLPIINYSGIMQEG